MSAERVLKSLKGQDRMESMTIIEATENNENEILEFIAKEQPGIMYYTFIVSMKIILESYPGSVIIAKDKNDVICGIAAGVPFDGLFLLSSLLVAKQFRHQYITTSVLKPLFEKAGNRNITMVSREYAVPTYKRRGFKTQQYNVAWRGIFHRETCNLRHVQDDTEISKVSLGDVEDIVNYDKGLHSYPRDKLIKECVVHHVGRQAFVARQSNQVVGYGFIITFQPDPHKIILYADSENIARQLLSKLVNELADGTEVDFTAPIVDGTSPSRRFAEEIGMQEYADYRSATMYLKYPVTCQWKKIFCWIPSYITIS